MLSQEIINAALPVSRSILDSGYSLQVKQGSPIGVLNHAIHSVNGEGGVEDIASSVQQAAKPLPGYDFDAHSGELLELTRVYKQKLAGSIGVARNIINPLVRKILTEATASKADIENVRPVDLTITIIELHSMYDNFGITTALDPFRSPKGVPKSKLTPDDTANLSKAITLSSYLGTIRTGSESVDSETTRLVGDDGWSPYFETWISPTDSGMQTILDRYRYNEDLMNFLFFRGVLSGKLEGYDVDSEASYVKVALAEGMRHSAEKVITRINAIRAFERSKPLSIGQPKDGKLYMHKDNYMKWLNNENGSSKAVLGAYIAAPSMPSNVVQDMRTNPGRFETAYDQKATAVRNLSRVRSNVQIGQTILLGITNHINNEVDAIDRPALHTRLKTVTGKMPYRGVRELSEYILHVTCEVLALDTDAYALLTGIQSHLDANPKDSMTKAALSSSTLLLARWLASQIKVDKGTDYTASSVVPVTALR